jgi:hypothetical protein
LAFAAGVLTIKLTSGTFSNTSQVVMTITNFKNPASTPATPPSVEVFQNLAGTALDQAVVSFPAVTDPVTPATPKASASSVFVNSICVVVVLVLSMLF